MIKKATLCIFVLFIFFCCKNKDKENWQINLPETSNYSEINQWGVVIVPFSKLRKNPDPDSEIVCYMPKNDKIVKIIKKNSILSTFNNERGYWILVDYEGERGWIFSTFIEVFHNYNEAEMRAKDYFLEE